MRQSVNPGPMSRSEWIIVMKHGVIRQAGTLPWSKPWPTRGPP